MIYIIYERWGAIRYDVPWGDWPGDGAELEAAAASAAAGCAQAHARTVDSRVTRKQIINPPVPPMPTTEHVQHPSNA